MKRHLFLAALFAAAGPARAQDAGSAPPMPSEAEILKALQADSQANGTTNATPAPTPVPGPVARVFQSLNPDMSFITDIAAAGFSEPLEMNGDHDPTSNGFNLQALELAAGAAVDPYFRFDTNIVFKDNGSEIEEAYGTTLGLPYGLQIRAGKFLTRFGRFNATHPHTWTFSDDPLVIGRFFGGDGNRGIGLEVSELLNFLPWYAEVVVASNDTRGNGPSFLPSHYADGTPVTIQSLQDLQYLGALNQFFPLGEDLSLAWGLSGISGENATGPHRKTEVLGTDVYLKYRPLTDGSVTIVSLHAELLQRRYDTPAGLAVESGAFAQLFWRFAARWGAGLSAEYVSATAVDPMMSAPGVQQRYKADLTFWPTEFSRIRLQYDVEPAGANHPDLGQALFLAMEFAVGAHGAHKF